MTITTMPRLALLALGITALPLAAFASSDDAWEAMRKDVAKSCKAATTGSIEKPKVAVDPFGSQSFGLALVSGKPKGGKGTISIICVYDKQKKTVEIGGELTPDILKAAK